MSDTMTSPNMGLVIPIATVDAGPDYANSINACLLTLDAHDHSTGKGVPIGPSGLNINADLPFAGNNATGLRSTRYSAQSVPLSLTADYLSLSVSGVDLYYLDGNGNAVRITQSGGVAGSPGSIGSLTSPASATYVAGTPAFVFQSAANTPASLDGGSCVLRNLTASSKGVTLSAPPALAADYEVLYPAALPAAQYFLTLDHSGNIAAPIAYTAGITGSNIASGTITGTNITSSINLPGNAVQENGKNLVVSAANASTSLAVVRGYVDLSGNSPGSGSSYGEGWTATRVGTGFYQITFTTSFASVPVVTVTLDTASNVVNVIPTNLFTTSKIDVQVWNFSTVHVNSGFNFIAIGPR